MDAIGSDRENPKSFKWLLKTLASLVFLLAIARVNVDHPAMKVFVRPGGTYYLARYSLAPVDLRSWNEYESAKAVKDEFGVLGLVAEGKLLDVKPGTRVLVIDSAYFKKRVRVLEGERAGSAVWVRALELRKEGEVFKTKDGKRWRRTGDQITEVAVK